MKIIGNLLLLVGLIAGSLSAATAYLTRFDPSDDALVGGALGQPAGLDAPADRVALRAEYDAGDLSATAFVRGVEARTPIATTDAPLDAETIARLDGEGVKHIRMKTFDLGRRWPFWWVFLLSAVALTIGSLLLRSAAKAEIASGGLLGADRPPPDRALQSVIDAVNDLCRELDAMGDPGQKLHLLVTKIDAIQRGPVQDFVDGGTVLTGKIGLGHFAEVMDRFAVGERQLNRAWSAAADGVLVEADECIRAVTAPMVDAQGHMHP